MSTSLTFPRVCSSCRLRSLTAAKTYTRRRLGHPFTASKRSFEAVRTFSTTRRLLTDDRASSDNLADAIKALRAHLDELDHASTAFNLPASTAAQLSRTEHVKPQTLVESTNDPVVAEQVVRDARRAFGDSLPDDYLSPEEYKIYERLYGTPIRIQGDHDPAVVDFEEAETQGELEERETAGTGLLRENANGELEEVPYLPEVESEDEEVELMSEEGEEEMSIRELEKLEKSKRGKFFIKAAKPDLDAAILNSELPRAEEASMLDLDQEWKGMDVAGRSMYLDDVRYMKLESHYRNQGKADEADELLQMLFIRYRAQSEAELESEAVGAHEASEKAPIRFAPEDQDEDIMEEVEHFDRGHPLTVKNRFGTLPSTFNLPKSTFVDPVSVIISGSAPKHLAEASHKIFGGVGLPYSTANPGFAKGMQQKPIPLEASQTKMSDIEADAFFASVMPGVYASIMSVLVETRKRLGASWLQNMMTQEGGPRILDAGAAGAGVLAVRDVLRAEWQSMHDKSDDPDSPSEVTVAGGEAGGAPIDAPLGKATVLTSNDALRQRASLLLENTAFLPRLPDYVHASDEQARERGKFDIVIAPHTLWPLKEDYLRKQHVSNLWSLVSAQGGVLILLEKGVPRGFEMIGGARDHLLDRRIASPGSEKNDADVDSPEYINIDGVIDKEKGMIIAPCTNHKPCPMYVKGGPSKGRKDYCHFEQRYVRPAFLQKILGARDKNHEDVQFSYMSVMRGRDLRDADELAVTQGEKATNRAFLGYERNDVENELQVGNFDPTAPAVPEVEDVYEMNRAAGPHSLSLPRAIMPPLKRTGHVILDLCTPTGTLERWTVPRSFSKQAFRDARKSSWGDLWALGAKTRVQKNVRLGSGKEELGGVDNSRLVSSQGKSKHAQANTKKSKGKNTIEVPYDSQGQIKGDDMKVVTGGRMRQGKVSGIRDKRDKTGSGRGRRKSLSDV